MLKKQLNLAFNVCVCCSSGRIDPYAQTASTRNSILVEKTDVDIQLNIIIQRDVLPTLPIWYNEIAQMVQPGRTQHVLCRTQSVQWS